MAKPYKIPDFRKMYPEASEEVIAVLRTTERKMQYQEYDLKRARNIVDPKTGEVMTVPSREDSYERLQEMAVQFPEEDDAKLKLNHFVYALKSQRELAHRLENDCIIIWGSEQSPRDNQKKCTYSEYKNVLRDITRVQGNTLDITSIFKDPKPKAIIHIDEIICMLREGDIQQLQEKFAEYIGELEK